MVGMPPITISTTCHKSSPFSVAFSASISESSISNPSLSVGRAALPPAKSSLPVLICLPLCAPSYIRSPNSWGSKPGVMESILTLCFKTSEHYLTIRKTQRTARQYTVACRSLSSIRVVTRRIHRMNNCMQSSSVFTTVLRFQIEGLERERISEICRCTGSQSWRGGDRRND